MLGGNVNESKNLRQEASDKRHNRLIQHFALLHEVDADQSVNAQHNVLT